MSSQDVSSSQNDRSMFLQMISGNRSNAGDLETTVKIDRDGTGTLVTLTSLLVRPELIEEVNRHVDIVGHALSEHLQTTRSGCGVTR